MFSGMDSGSQMEIVKALRLGVISRHSAAHFTTLHLRKSRLREPDLGTMKDNAGKWNRDEQFCVFLLFVAINILSANSRANASIHLRLDHDNSALALRYGLHADGIAGSHSRVDEIVSVPASRRQRSCRFPKPFRMFVNELNGDDLIRHVRH